MKVREISHSAVHLIAEVCIETTSEQSQELRNALKIIQKYQDLASKEYKKEYNLTPQQDGDMYHFEYGVKNDKVIVTISVGAIG